jgi:hypothetical protein
VSRPDSPEDQERHEDIGALLAILGRCVADAKRENAQRWTIQQDLEKMQGLLDRLKALDEEGRSE